MSQPRTTDNEMTDIPASVTFELNGSEVSVRGDHPHLLTALRDELDITSPKDGCSPTGQCGCCTILLDGKARVACQTPLDKVAGRTVLTLEGVDADERERYANAFASCGALAMRLLYTRRRDAGEVHAGQDHARQTRPHPGERGAAARWKPLSLHGLHQDPRCRRGPGGPRPRDPSRAVPTGHRHQRCQVRGERVGPGRSGVHRRPPPGRPPPWGGPSRCTCTGRRHRHRHPTGHGRTGSRRRLHCRRHPRRVAVRPHPQGLADVHSRRRSHQLSGRCACARRSRGPGNGTPSRAIGRGDLRRPPTDHESGRGGRHDRACRMATRRKHPFHQHLPARRRRDGPTAVCTRRGRDVPDPAHRSRLSRTRVNAGAAR